MSTQGSKEDPIDVDEQPDELTADELPLGPHQEEDRLSAIQLCYMYNKHSSTMPEKVRNELLRLLKTGAFQHTEESKHKPKHHRIYSEMWDQEIGAPKWLNTIYERWFILVGVFGMEVLEKKCKGIMDAIVRRYRWDLDKDLTYRNGPIDEGEHVRCIVAELWAESSERDVSLQELRRTTETMRKDVDFLKSYFIGHSRTGSEESNLDRAIQKEYEEEAAHDEEEEFRRDLAMFSS
ncbi:hypothetical protein FSARC_9159 [Fusarium sarcochroum]|uniref:Uncharacterized protein n=1 Tax=Fusarium sarcochroum TaxID=1208366 RepID=A0A8H4TRW8_9HYPO|nr:hypothetical protein FSARC_9159 [Fusarium sarcochroum]